MIYYKDSEGKFGKLFSVEHHCFIKPKVDPKLSVLSKSDIKYLDQSIEENGSLEYYVIKEKSHDFAWNSASLNRDISFDNILREKGVDDEYILFLKDRAKLNIVG
jgi:hypothetical protein